MGQSPPQRQWNFEAKHFLAHLHNFDYRKVVACLEGMEVVVFACISVDSEVLTVDSTSCSSLVLAPLVSGPSPSLTAEKYSRQQLTSVRILKY